MVSLASAVSVLPGIGPKKKEQLEALSIQTIRDLVYYRPFRYENIDREATIATLVPGQKVSLAATVETLTPIKTRKFRSMLKAKLRDATGVLEVTWFNTPYVLSALSVGSEYHFLGKVGEFQGKLTLTNPTFQRSADESAGLVPIYHETARVTSRWLRKMIAVALGLPDIHQQLDSPSTQQDNYISVSQALKWLHGPEDDTQLQQALKRLSLDEMLALMRQVMLSKREFLSAPAVSQIQVSEKELAQFVGSLPYTPTPSQQSAIAAIQQDIQMSHPMHRLVQGEVGSGKTTVAAFALWAAAQAGETAIMICPTRVLAEQHHRSLTQLLSPLKIDIELKSGGKGLIDTGTSEGSSKKIIVGTHALFFDTTIKPSLVVIDEEHRFGVEQRRHFLKDAHKPHMLSMTATPIPRTVALTALADYDLIHIQPHRPPNTVKTWLVPEKKRKDSYAWLEKQLATREDDTQTQALVVCPFIDPSEVAAFASVKAATTEFKKIEKRFKKQTVALLHGRMKEEQKSEIFAKMLKGEIDILVTTPVVEVGVDIPNASVILIEGAERFGLAQLHQLRGRVGRRGQQAYCLLFQSPPPEEQEMSVFDFSGERLTFFSDHYDGTQLAEYDLKNRGSGELLGERQHGFGDLVFARWNDQQLIEECKTLLDAELQTE